MSKLKRWSIIAAAVILCGAFLVPSGICGAEDLSEDTYKDLEASRSVDANTSGNQADVSEVSVSQDEMLWYVRGISGKMTGASAYVGMQEIGLSEMGYLGEEGGPAPKTLFLIDNSNSIAHSGGSPEKISAIMTRLIWNHQPGERFAIKTFSDQAQTVVDFTDNYDELRLAAENLTFQDQDTYLRNVLYEEIYTLMDDGEDAYKRIIIISDGSDDSRLGVTYEELTDLLNNENFFLPVYTIAPDYKPAEGELDKLFALSRRTDSPYFFLQEYENVTDIADEIVTDGHEIAYFRIPIPADMRTGEVKGITLRPTTSTGDYVLNHSMVMPSASGDDIDSVLMQQKEDARAAEEAAAERAQEETEKEKADLEARRALEERVAALEAMGGVSEEDAQGLEARISALEQAKRTETEREAYGSGEVPQGQQEETEYQPGVGVIDQMVSMNEEYFFVRSIRSVVWSIIGVLLIMLLSYVIYSDRTRRNRRGFEEVSGEKISQAVQPDLTKTLTKSVILYDAERPQIRYSISVGQDATLGRSKARCDIAFPTDRMMGGRQARIFFREGKVYIENLDTADSTKLDDRTLHGTLELKNGSRLTLGTTKLRVQYE